MADYKRDDNGNMIEDANHIYKYNKFDKLIQVEDKNGNVLVKYTYDNHRLQSRTDANGVTETYVRAKKSYGREFAVYQGTDRREIGFFDVETGDYYVFERKEANGTVGVYTVYTNLRGSVEFVASVDNNMNKTIVQRYEYSYSGELKVYDANNQLTTDAPISRFLFRQGRYERITGFYFIHGRWYDPKTGQYISPDPAFKQRIELIGMFGYDQISDMMGLYGRLSPHGLFGIGPDPVEVHEARVKYALKKQREATKEALALRRKRKQELFRINQNWYTRGGAYIKGVGKTAGTIALESGAMLIDLMYGPDNQYRFSTVGKALRDGASWGDIASQMGEGIKALPGKTWTALKEGDMEGFGASITEAVLLVDAGTGAIKGVAFVVRSAPSAGRYAMGMGKNFYYSLRAKRYGRIASSEGRFVVLKDPIMSKASKVKSLRLQPTDRSTLVGFGSSNALERSLYAFRLQRVQEEITTLTARVAELHPQFQPVWPDKVTTAAMSTNEGTRLIALGGRELRLGLGENPGDLIFLRQGELGVNMPGIRAQNTRYNFHAEWKLESAASQSFGGGRVAVPIWNICLEECIPYLQSRGWVIVAPRAAVHPKNVGIPSRLLRRRRPPNY